MLAPNQPYGERQFFFVWYFFQYVKCSGFLQPGLPFMVSIFTDSWFIIGIYHYLLAPYQLPLHKCRHQTLHFIRTLLPACYL